MKLDSIHQLLVKWSTSEYGWLSSAITLERSSIRAAKALSLIEINDTRRGLVDDSGAFFLRPDRWLCWRDLRVIVYSTLIKYIWCLKNTQSITNADSLAITKNYKWREIKEGPDCSEHFQLTSSRSSLLHSRELSTRVQRNFTAGFLISGKKWFYVPSIEEKIADNTLTISLWPKERPKIASSPRKSTKFSMKPL